jgi:hypothetical protein
VYEAQRPSTLHALNRMGSSLRHGDPGKAARVGTGLVWGWLHYLLGVKTYDVNTGTTGATRG